MPDGSTEKSDLVLDQMQQLMFLNLVVVGIRQLWLRYRGAHHRHRFRFGHHQHHNFVEMQNELPKKTADGSFR
jgi:hypothetical protein